MRAADLALIASVRAELADGRARQAREAARIRQADIAAAANVTRQAVSQWESGQSVPSAAHALAYGRLLRQLARTAA